MCQLGFENDHIVLFIHYIAFLQLRTVFHFCKLFIKAQQPFNLALTTTGVTSLVVWGYIISHIVFFHFFFFVQVGFASHDS